MTAILEVEAVSRTYPGAPPVNALQQVTMSVELGEFVAVVGPSGSGKSTLLNVIGTLDTPSAGSVRLGGQHLGGLTDPQLAGVRAHYIGFVFQQFHLAPGVGAINNVADGLLYQGMSLRERQDRARIALERVGLGHRMDHMPHQMSGGERQRVAIARAVVGDPPLLLADEPTGNLDTANGDAVWQLLKELNATGTTIVMITHDRDIASRLSRQIHMRDGAVERDLRQALA